MQAMAAALAAVQQFAWCVLWRCCATATTMVCVTTGVAAAAHLAIVRVVVDDLYHRRR